MDALPGKPWDAAYVSQYLRKYQVNHTGARSARQAQSAVSLARTPAGGDVLDCPCGNGRHSLPLARAGFRTTGVDAAEAMLAMARSQPSASGQPSWIAGDYRRLPFADASFDTVLNMFTSFGFYGDLEDAEVLREFRRVLRPGGRVVIDTTHRDRLAREPDSAAVASGPRGPDAAITGSVFDLQTGWLETADRDPASEAVVRFRLRVYAATELGTMLRLAGFEDVEMFGGLDGSPLSWDTRLIAIATRPAGTR